MEQLEGELFPREKTTAIKGMVALGVICFHLTFTIESGNLFTKVFWNTGYLFVGIFFFISGYGMQLALKKNSGCYRKKIVHNKIPRLIIPYLSIFFVYYLAFQIMKTPNKSLKDCLITLVNGHSIVENSWYVYAIIFLCLFLCMISYVGNKSIQDLLVICMIIMYCVICKLLQLGSHWTSSCGAFIFGYCCANNTRIMESIVKNKYRYLCLSILCIVLERILWQTTSNHYLIELAVRWATCIAVSILVFLFCNAYSKTYWVETFLSNISYELYLTHGLVILLLHNSKWTVKPDGFMVILTILVSIVVSSVWHRINEWIYSISKI